MILIIITLTLILFLIILKITFPSWYYILIKDKEERKNNKEIIKKGKDAINGKIKPEEYIKSL